MDFIQEKIRVMTEKLGKWRLLQSLELEYSYAPCAVYKTQNTPPEDALWQPAERGKRFGGVDTHFWLRMHVPAQAKQPGKELRLCVKTGREGQWDARNPQFTVFLNGETAQALDTNHTWLPLEFETDYEVVMYLYSGMIGGDFDVLPSLDTVDLAVESLYYDIHVPYLCMQELDGDSYDFIKIRDCLDRALLELDLRDVYSEAFYAGIARAAEFMKREFYEKVCGDSQSIVSCIGHTHIDVAWHWTVAQTREKAQRSFSTVLNMMRRYDDYIFMSSQPQLYQFVKEDDPALYAQIKERVRAGKWEPEGAMWLEADTNLISGESLVRQIMYGKRFMAEEFGVDNKILWLPDVFGYSGALPQILKKSGVTQFFTAKMSWNETNKMPEDTFIWEGIDGSRVFANVIQTYVQQLNPRCVHNTWKRYKNKSLTDSALLTFGYGDGGGGPTYEMMENHRRLQYGIPGMPKTVVEKAGGFFDRIEADFTEKTAALRHEPKWVGEMYLEMHRGTYTSMAKNKRNNRKSELLYLEAEALSTTDMVLGGGAYPEETLRKNQTTILLNQFHDIIPGSSIKEVYDVTDTEYAQILSDGKAIADEKLDSIKAGLSTGGGIFVYNPTPFAVSDYVTADGKTVYAQDVPAHGWRVVPAVAAACGVTVSEHCIENDVIRVCFNDQYHIVSVYDKQAGREVLADGAEANRLEVFEDYPRAYDAWEITNYYQQKMWIADDVSGVTLLANGIRVKRKYQQSEIVQDIVLRGGSKRIDFVTTVDWHEDHVLLKAAFPVDIRSSFATYDIQFGNLERPTHANTSWDAAKFEVCAHKWADLSEGGYGVSLLNDCKYGYSIAGNVMKLSLLKAATDPNPEADRGMHTFTYALYPHEGDYRQGGTVQEGYLLNMPLTASAVAQTTGSLPDCFSMVSSSAENVVVETIKKAEDGNAVVVRLYETYSQKAETVVQAGFDFSRVFLCDLLENEMQELEHQGRNVLLHVKNFEIVTLKFVRE